MNPISIIIALAGSVLVIFMKPMNALWVYLVGLFWYPQALTIPLGRWDFSVGRIFIILLCMRTFFSGADWRKFKLDWVDCWVLCVLLGEARALTYNVDVMKVIESRSGALCDSVMPYFVVRRLVDDKDKMILFLKRMVLTAAPLAPLGVYQCLTGINPWSFMAAYAGWGLGDMLGGPSLTRNGLFRAAVSFISSPIAFGLFFAVLVPIAVGLWKQRVCRPLTLAICLVLLVIGTLTSLSSAPLFAIVIGLSMIAAYPVRRYWRPMVAALLVMIIFVEIYSNRHFFEVLTILSFDQGTAYYRTELIKEAFGGGMTGHWLAGYGFVGIGPGSDNTNFHWMHLDTCNIIVDQLARYGLLGLVPFLALTGMYFRRLYQAGQKACTEQDRWLVWCVASSLVGWFIAMQTVPALSQLYSLLYLYIALCCNMARYEYRSRFWTLPRMAWKSRAMPWTRLRSVA